MSMGDIFFWIGVVFGVVGTLVVNLLVVAGIAIYEIRKEKKNNVV